MPLPELGLESLVSQLQRLLFAVARSRFRRQICAGNRPEPLRSAEGPLHLHDAACREAVNHDAIVIHGLLERGFPRKGLVREAGGINLGWHDCGFIAGSANYVMRSKSG